jgi:hypothetical protein
MPIVTLDRNPDGTLKSTVKTCREPGCDGEHKARGYCDLHYHRWRRNGHTRLIGRTRETCTVEGCTELQHSKGLCPTHRSRHRRHGDPHTVLPRGGGVKGRKWAEEKLAPHGTPSAKARHRREGSEECDACAAITTRGKPKDRPKATTGRKPAARPAPKPEVEAFPETGRTTITETTPGHLAGFLAARRTREAKARRSAA